MKRKIEVGDIVVVIAETHEDFRKVGKVIETPTIPTVGGKMWVVVKFVDKRKVLFARHKVKHVDDAL